MSQTEQVLHYLRGGGELSPVKAFQLFGIMRLGARIYDLRRVGHTIRARTERQGRKAWSVYRLCK